MKCIGNKCPFCNPHDFRLSYFYCKLDGVSFKQDAHLDYQCVIDSKLKQIQNKYNELNQIKETILLSQKEE